MYRNSGGKTGNHLDDFWEKESALSDLKLILTYVEL